MASDAKVLAIEPNPQMVERLRGNLALVSDATRAETATVMVVESAVGDDNGEAQLMLPSGANSFGRAYIGKSEQGVTVKISTLMNILESCDVDHISALKIDIEGHEDKALKPFLQNAPSAMLPRAIVIEHTSNSDWDDDVLALLAERGYVETARTRGNALLSFQG
ncbi:MAG: FkbM family methyltransferase [Phycisphaerales bacterium]|nr:FkbM family methyltransferase [Phycisphaerales bacterium]